MINKDKIIFETKTYFTCSYSGPIGVKILKFIDDDHVLVKAGKHTFSRPIQYVFNEHEHARVAGRDWEHSERRRKRNKKKAKSLG